MPHSLPHTLGGPEFVAVYNALSFVIASMGATTIYIFLNSLWVGTSYKSAVTCSGIVTLIAFYHYFRIFNSWNDAYTIVCNYGQPAASIQHAVPEGYDTTTNTSAFHIGEDKCMAFFTGTPFNDAYRYMDWLLTVPLLLCELVLVMKLPEGQTGPVCLKLGIAAAAMIILGYPGETSSDTGTRWAFWALAMVPFCYIVYTLFLGLSKAIESVPQSIRGQVSTARTVTVISWLTYPVVYVLPMFGIQRDASEIGIQIGYSFSDVISKCLVGIMITHIAIARSKLDGVLIGEKEPLIN